MFMWISNQKQMSFKMSIRNECCKTNHRKSAKLPLIFKATRGKLLFSRQSGKQWRREPSQKFSLGQKLIIGMRDESFKSYSKLEV